MLRATTREFLGTEVAPLSFSPWTSGKSHHLFPKPIKSSHAYFIIGLFLSHFSYVLYLKRDTVLNNSGPEKHVSSISLYNKNMQWFFLRAKFSIMDWFYTMLFTSVVFPTDHNLNLSLVLRERSWLDASWSPCLVYTWKTFFAYPYKYLQFLVIDYHSLITSYCP